MGIKDLLKFMKPHIEPIHIKKFTGKRVGIDAYSWLHKGAYSCSMELHLNTEGEKKKQYLNYCMHRINMLRHHNITPVVVFDGCSLPCKALTEEDRHRKRKANRDLAMAKLKEGNARAASELFQRAISITPSMAHQLIQILRAENIEFVVAPNEADAQLAYLSKLEVENGGIAAVISEDSDLLAYGCPSVVFKMDRFGNGEEIVLNKVFNSASLVPSFRNFDTELFIGMCVLAGCDFLPSVPGIGIGKAYALVSKYRNFDRVISVLKFEKSKQVPEDYLKSFKEAVAVFQHALIYDAQTKKLKHIKPLPRKLLESFDEGLDFLGLEIHSSMAIAIAEGKVDPSTMEAFNCFPSNGVHMNPTTISQTHSLLREDSSDISTQKSCFTTVLSHKTKKQRAPVVNQKPILKERNATPVLEEMKYLNEGVAFEKLVFPLKSEASEYIKISRDENQLIVPQNNPFKKRKSDHTECTNEQVSVVTEVESLEVFSVTPESQQSVDSKRDKKIDWASIGTTQKKLKTSTNKKKSCILNFFSRV